MKTAKDKIITNLPEDDYNCDFCGLTESLGCDCTSQLNKLKLTTGHTPGPWVVRTTEDGRIAIYSKADSLWITEMLRPMPILNSEANAHLIAAAPEMLEALKELKNQIRVRHKMNVKKDYSLLLADAAAGKAIAKAEGRGR